jgi:hypothetical protein
LLLKSKSLKSAPAVAWETVRAALARGAVEFAEEHSKKPRCSSTPLHLCLTLHRSIELRSPADQREEKVFKCEEPTLDGVNSSPAKGRGEERRYSAVRGQASRSREIEAFVPSE